MSLDPTLCQSGIARFDFAPGKSFPIAEVDFTQAGTNLKSDSIARGYHLRRLPGAAKIAGIDSLNRIFCQPIDDSGELPTAAIIELWIGMSTE